MLAKTLSFALSGLDAYPVVIEADITSGLPLTTIVGLPDNAVKESRERIRLAIKNSGLAFPSGRITINLAPADIKKEGPSFDLAIALSVLAADEQISAQALYPYAFLGELALDGSLRPVTGTLPVALACKDKGLNGLIVPWENAVEAALANSINVYPAKNLSEIIAFLSNPQQLLPAKADMSINRLHNRLSTFDFADVKGQAFVKRGLEIAASGGHNVLMIGPPGSGKTMLAKRLAGILPDMNLEEILETTKIHSIMGMLKKSQGVVTSRPFRSPHHTASSIALVGGGSNPKPGEVTLAHNGILFLDELGEFASHTLEVLRQPMEDRSISVARANRALNFPCSFMLVAAMNPCPCGFMMSALKPCSCTPGAVQKYLSKISGPLLDRIDLHLEVPALKAQDIFCPEAAENSSTIRQRTSQTRALQEERFSKSTTRLNAQMNSQELKTFCLLNDDAKGLLKHALERLGLSARAHDKILKVARTIADMEQSTEIKTAHIAEAIGYRRLDRIK